MKRLLLLFNFLMVIFTVSSFGGSEDRFIKKYAMMKIYESCFGPEVVKQIRKEMKAACTKCSNLASLHSTIEAPTPVQTQPDNTLFSPNNQPGFNVEKLQQAILAYRPVPSQQPTLFRPYGPDGVVPPFYNQPYANPTGYPHLLYPGFQQQQHPAQIGPYGFPILGHPYFNQRMSRDMDIRGQLEALTNRMSGKVRNVTCVMQELGYLDENLEPNFAKITERISNLPVGDELKKDMQDGVTFCQQFSQCVPEIKKEKSPLSRELIRPMFFFKCYKHKKLEACIMKDVREKYAGVTDEDFDSEMEIRRTGKSSKISKEDNEIDELASSMYEFLYASDSNLDLDSIL